jgi:hypothetical protein
MALLMVPVPPMKRIRIIEKVYFCFGSTTCKNKQKKEKRESLRLKKSKTPYQ